MLNSDQIVMTIVIKALDFLFGQFGEWLKGRRATRKRKRKPKPHRRHRLKANRPKKNTDT